VKVKQAKKGMIKGILCNSTHICTHKNRSKVCPQHTYAFSLIELLVVVAIISILAAMLMPALHQAREKARQSVCLNNMKQIGFAVHMYLQDWNGCFPLGWTYQNVLVTNGYAPSGEVPYKGIWYCPSNKKWELWLDNNYLVNSYLGVDGVSELYTKKLSEVKGSSGTVYLADAAVNSANGKLFFNSIDSGRIAWVHSGGANVLWVDNHVSWQKEGSLTDGMFTPKDASD